MTITVAKDESNAVRVVARDGVATVLHDLGGDGPTLLFAHATGLHGLVWKPIADYLRPHTHCFALDLRGHGDSRVNADADLSWDGFGLDILAAVQAIADGGVVGVGHSLGGAALVCAELLSPGTFTHLLLYEPALHAPDVAVEQRESRIAASDMMVRIASRRKAAFPSVEAALGHYVDRPPMAQFQAAVLSAYVRHGFLGGSSGHVELKCAPETEAAIYAAYDHDTVKWLSAVNCPVTLVTGGDTDDYQRCSVEALSVQVESPTVVLSHLDHFGPMQNPRQFAETVERHALGNN